jgi:hypothetical protein
MHAYIELRIKMEIKIIFNYIYTEKRVAKSHLILKHLIFYKNFYFHRLILF